MHRSGARVQAGTGAHSRMAGSELATGGGMTAADAS
jgi:hypothetical protein